MLLFQGKKCNKLNICLFRHQYVDVRELVAQTGTSMQKCRQKYLGPAKNE